MRTGNWNLHLVAVSIMINLFAATGHLPYAKCACLYLQNMSELETNYPWVYIGFATHGYHTVRRSDRCWAGLWSDLIIEQVLMQFFKSRRCQTTGRGVTESVNLTWLKSMYWCAEVHESLCILTNLIYTKSDQYLELGRSRKKHGNTDSQKLSLWFNCNEPFDLAEFRLKRLSTGLVASDKIDCDNAEAVGAAIQNALDNICIEDAVIPKGSGLYSSALETWC